MDKMIKGTETEKSLLKAFAGESQAKEPLYFFLGDCKERRV